jgi:sterol desaturase/sphingolipid hydroxylase (fatty acid hydroxylase superfamily)
VFSTAAMEPLEAALLFTAPYLALTLASHHLLGAWNPAALAALVSLEASMNMGGHCGYDLPWWLHVAVTGGLGLLPWCATSRSHYIHHVDPRYNRGLYFTWWDQLLGTFREDHPSLDRPGGDKVGPRVS